MVVLFNFGFKLQLIGLEVNFEISYINRSFFWNFYIRIKGRDLICFWWELWNMSDENYRLCCLVFFGGSQQKRMRLICRNEIYKKSCGFGCVAFLILSVFVIWIYFLFKVCKMFQCFFGELVFFSLRIFFRQVELGDY